MKKLFYLLFILFILFSFNINANEPQNEIELVKAVSTELFEQINLLENKNPDNISPLVENILFPHVDYKFISLKLLGTNLRKIKKDKIKEFINITKPYLIRTLSTSLSFYDNQNYAVNPKSKKTKKTAAVYVTFFNPNKPNIDIIFKLRKDKKGNWKLYDLIPEGISMLSSKQSEFSPIIRKHGIDHLMDILKEKS